jgi:hypothetical protein
MEKREVNCTVAEADAIIELYYSGMSCNPLNSQETSPLETGWDQDS